MADQQQQEQQQRQQQQLQQQQQQLEQQRQQLQQHGSIPQYTAYPSTYFSARSQYGQAPYYSPYHAQTYGNPYYPHNQSAAPYPSALPTPATGQHVTTTPQPPKVRSRNIAIIKDPKTLEVVDLKEESKTSSSTKASAGSSTTNESSNTNVNSTVSMSNSNDNTSSSPSVSNILLQKVTEGLNDQSKESVPTNNKEIKSNEISAAPATPIKAKVVIRDPKTDQVAHLEKETPPSPKAVVVEPEESSEINNTKESPKEEGASEEVSNSETISETKQIISTKDGDVSAPAIEVSIPDKNIVNGDAEAKTHDSTTVSDASEVITDKESEDGPALHYEPGQYNPISNRTGRRVYTKEFLLEVCEKICKIIHEPQGFEEKNDMFAPSYAQVHHSNRQSNPLGRQSQPNYMGRNSAGQEGRQRKIIPPSSSLTQEVELKTVANPWRRAQEVKDDATTDDVAEIESLKKKFRSILNKLTPNNFESLSNKVTELKIKTEAELGNVIDIIFQKALSEPGYCVLYGQMCSHLKKTTSGESFGTTLLKRCQVQFQSDIYAGLNLEERQKKIDEEQDPDIKKHLQDELYDDMYRCRMRGLGLIKFIGVLYKIQMLNDAIMFGCINRLLSDTSEESLECLCDLLSTIGEKLDRSSQNPAKDEKKSQKTAKANAYQGGQRSAAAVVASGTPKQKETAELTSLDPVFEQLHKIRKNEDLPLSLRIRFKLLDVCDLREKNKWQSKNSMDNNPKKIEEIREAHKEKLESEKRQNAMGPRRSQEGRRGLGHSSGSSSQISSLANESSNIRNATNMHASSSSHSIRDHQLGDNMKQNSHNDRKRDVDMALHNFFPKNTGPPTESSALRPITQAKSSATTGSGGITGVSLRPYTSKAVAAPATSTKTTATNANSGTSA